MEKLIKRVGSGNALTGKLEFHTVTGVDLSTSPTIWNAVVEVIQATTNVVVLSKVSSEGFTFATEREGAADAEVIQAAIRELGTLEDEEAVSVDLSTAVVNSVVLNLHGGEEEGEDEGEDDSGAFGINESNTSVITDGSGNVVLTVQVTGAATSLRVNHSLSNDYFTPEKLPKFTIYAEEDQAALWGDTTSQNWAASIGVSASYTASTKTFVVTIGYSNDAQSAFRIIHDDNGGNIEFYLQAKNANGEKSQPIVALPHTIVI